MFIIKNGVGYKIIDGKAFKIDFDENENIIISKEEIEFDKNDKLYSYNELYRKLNIKYFAQLKKVTPKEKPSFKSTKSEKVDKKEEDKKEEE